MSEYIATIGLEVHCELKTETKLFCSCRNVFGAKPNTNTCPVCAGHPGVLPVLNRKAVEYTVRAGCAIGCEINRFSKWDRKNYFYPDLPKAWQTSQYDLPLCIGGSITFDVNGEEKTVRLNRIHLEEDAGKLVHSGNCTMVDYNRCGVPLMECVTEPDMHSADEAVAFLEELASIFRYSGVSDCRMQEGSIRADVNLSLSRPGEPLGTRTETKNLNSFRSVRRAIEAEIRRQTEVLESGGKVVQETRHFDDNTGTCYGMRSKEDAQDYRYFPEPDLMPVVMSDEDIARIKAEVPELKRARRKRYVSELGLSDYDASQLTSEPEIAELFDGAVKAGANAKKAANYVMSEIMRKGKTAGEDGIVVGVTSSQLAELLALVDKGEINLVASRDVLDKMWLNPNESAAKAVDELGLRQNNDAGEIEKLVRDIIAANPGPANDFRNGNEKVLSFFVGQLMKATKGKTNPKIAGELVRKLLSE